jgi:hypothetical protein
MCFARAGSILSANRAQKYEIPNQKTTHTQSKTHGRKRVKLFKNHFATSGIRRRFIIKHALDKMVRKRQNQILNGA